MTPLVLFTLAWVSGILLSQAFHFPSVWLLFPLPLALALHLAWGDARWARRGVAMLVALSLGAGRMLLAQARVAPDAIGNYLGQDEVSLVGVIVEEPDSTGAYLRICVDTEEIALPDQVPQPISGRVLVYVPFYTRVSYGDRIGLRGNLLEPSDTVPFSYRDYLARQGIHAQLSSDYADVLSSHNANPIRDRLYRFKTQAHGVVKALLPEPEGALLAGILLGIEHDLPEDLVKAFRVTGTSHIVAISGMNLAVMAGSLNQWIRRLTKRRGGLLLSLVIVWSYVVLVGGAPSVLRAGVMSSVAMLGLQEQRRVHGPTALAAAALLLSLLDPFVFWDLGFQLSFVATGALMLYVPCLSTGATRWLEGVLGHDRAQKIVAALSDTMLVTLAVQVATLGITTRISGQVSLVALFTNLLILPVQPFVMVFGSWALLLGLVARPLGVVCGWLTWVFLWITITIVEWTARFPWATITLGSILPLFVWGYYVVLALVTWWVTLSPVLRLRLWMGVKALDRRIVAASAAILVLLSAYFVTQPDGKLHVAFLDVGHGDAVFVQTPEGSQVLIDGGSDPRRTLSALGKQMPFWDRSLDLVILTSPDEERLAGLVPVLERYRIASLAVGPEEGSGSTYAAWCEVLNTLGSSVESLKAGTVIDMAGGVRLEALWPPENVDGPVVLRVGYGDVHFLLMSGATTLVEDRVVATYGKDLRSNVLQLARQGAHTSTSPALVQVVSPEVAVVSLDETEALSGYVESRLLDTPIYSTCQHGTISMVSDGVEVKVKTAW